MLSGPSIEMQRVLDALSNKGVRNPCPECGNKCTVDPEYHPLRGWSGKSGTGPTANTNMYAALTCQSCGRTRLFDLQVLLDLQG